MSLIRAVSIGLVVYIVVIFVLFVIKRVSMTTFWLSAAIIAFFAYYLLPRLNKAK